MILPGHPYLTHEALAEIERRTGEALDPRSLPLGIGYWAPPTEQFPNPHEFVDSAWNEEEQRMVATYLRGVPRDRNWRFVGYSFCRFRCGISEVDLGTGDQSDGMYIWPLGFAHYVEAHWVRPPVRFVQHVREQLARAGA